MDAISAERLGWKHRYWNLMKAGSLGSLIRGTWGGKFRYWSQMNAPKVGYFHPGWHQVEPLRDWKAGKEVKVEIEKKRADWERRWETQCITRDGRCTPCSRARSNRRVGRSKIHVTSNCLTKNYKNCGKVHKKKVQVQNYYTSSDPHHDIYTFCYWQTFWHFIWPHSIWHIRTHSIWHIFWHSIWPLRSSGAHWARKVPGWGPAVLTELGRSQVEV